jgi:hypothetical protein
MCFPLSAQNTCSNSNHYSSQKPSALQRPHGPVDASDHQIHGRPPPQRPHLEHASDTTNSKMHNHSFTPFTCQRNRNFERRSPCTWNLGVTAMGHRWSTPRVSALIGTAHLDVLSGKLSATGSLIPPLYSLESLVQRSSRQSKTRYSKASKNTWRTLKPKKGQKRYSHDSVVRLIRRSSRYAVKSAPLHISSNVNH